MRLTARGKVVGSYRRPFDEYVVSQHGSLFSVHAPSGARLRDYSTREQAELECEAENVARRTWRGY
jgi:hypothetical protein